MRKRSISYGTVLGILLTVIVFVIVIIIVKNIFSSANYAGRWECKFAYAIASPLGLFSQESAVVQNAGFWGMVATGAAVAAVIAAAAAKGIYTRYSYLKAAELAEEMGKEYEKYAKVLRKGADEAIGKSIRDTISSQKFRTFLKGAIITGGTFAGIYALASASNSIAESMQKPILDTLCKPEVYGYVDTSDFNDTSILNSCINDLKKDVYNSTKLGFIDELNTNEERELCLLYVIAKLTIATYGETLGASARIGYGKLHYVLLVNYTLGEPIYLSDLLAVLDLMGINQNISYYDLIYSGGAARAVGEGEIYDAYNNYLQQNGMEGLMISDKGIAEIETLYVDINISDGSIIEEYGNTPDSDNILFDTNGEYTVNFIYDGQGGILIQSIVFTNSST